VDAIHSVKVTYRTLRAEVRLNVENGAEKSYVTVIMDEIRA